MNVGVHFCFPFSLKSASNISRHSSTQVYSSKSYEEWQFPVDGSEDTDQILRAWKCSQPNSMYSTVSLNARTSQHFACCLVFWRELCNFNRIHLLLFWSVEASGPDKRQDSTWVSKKGSYSLTRRNSVKAVGSISLCIRNMETSVYNAYTTHNLHIGPGKRCISSHNH